MGLVQVWLVIKEIQMTISAWGKFFLAAFNNAWSLF